MSNLEDRKHNLLGVNATVIHENIRYSRPMFPLGANNNEVEEEIVEQKNDILIYPRWKRAIVFSIQQFKNKYEEKITQKKKIIEEKNFNVSIINKLNRYALNTWNICFYKTLTPGAGERMCSYFLETLKLSSFKFIKFDFNNTCLCCVLNYQDSLKLLSLLENIVDKNSRDDVENSLYSLRLVKSFELLNFLDKSLINAYRENENTYYLIVPNDFAIFNNDLKEALKLFDLLLIDKDFKTDGIYITIEGTYNNFIEFLLFFEFPEFIFSMEIVTRVFDDPDAPANIYKALDVPPINLENIENLPIVFLLDSGLATDRKLLNPLLYDLVIAQDTIETLTHENPISTHATQMAGIISYGKQLHGVDDLLSFSSRELLPSARIYSLFMGTDRPKIGFWSLPSILDELNKNNAVLSQNIKIYNLSWNLKIPKKDNENINFVSYLLDKYLFFQPDILILNSVGNYIGDNDGNFHTFPNTNINIPSDAINILSIGSGKIIEDGSLSVSLGSSKNHYDMGVVSNELKNPVNDWKSIKRANNKYTKPDILGIGEYWNSTTIDQNLNLLTPNHCNGTSHATAYLSHLSAKIIGLYPDLKYAMTVEAILLHFLSKRVDFDFIIDETQPLYEVLNNRINEIESKSTFGRDEIINKENKFLKERYIGGGLVNVSNLNGLLYNEKNSLTFVIEGRIKLGSMQYHSINLIDYISKTVLEENTVKFDGFIAFRGLPYFKDSIGYNLINILASFWSIADYDTHGLKFNNKDKMEWSGNTTCQTKMRYPKLSIPSITTGANTFKRLIQSNNWSLDIIVKSIVWRDREKKIKEILKEYFDSLVDDGECVDFLENLYSRYKLKNNIDLNLVEIPYSIVVSVKLIADLDIYDNITLTEDIDF